MTSRTISPPKRRSYAAGDVVAVRGKHIAVVMRRSDATLQVNTIGERWDSSLFVPVSSVSRLHAFAWPYPPGVPYE